MSYIRVEREIAYYHAKAPDEHVLKMLEAESVNPPPNFTRVAGPVIERLTTTTMLLMGPDTVGIERYWEIVDVANMDSNWEN